MPQYSSPRVPKDSVSQKVVGGLRKQGFCYKFVPNMWLKANGYAAA
jgi:hypothetical protein